MSLRRQPAVNNISLAVLRFSAVHDLATFGDVPESVRQTLGIIVRETEQREEPRLSTVVRMGFVEKIVDDLATIDDNKVSVAKLHIALHCPTSRHAPDAPTNAQRSGSDGAGQGRAAPTRGGKP